MTNLYSSVLRVLLLFAICASGLFGLFTSQVARAGADTALWDTLVEQYGFDDSAMDPSALTIVGPLTDADSIQEAIDAATCGTVIVLGDGVWTETVQVPQLSGDATLDKRFKECGSDLPLVIAARNPAVDAYTEGLPGSGPILVSAEDLTGGAWFKGGGIVINKELSHFFVMGIAFTSAMSDEIPDTEADDDEYSLACDGEDPLDRLDRYECSDGYARRMYGQGISLNRSLRGGSGSCNNCGFHRNYFRYIQFLDEPATAEDTVTDDDEDDEKREKRVNTISLTHMKDGSVTGNWFHRNFKSIHLDNAERFHIAYNTFTGPFGTSVYGQSLADEFPYGKTNDFIEGKNVNRTQDGCGTTIEFNILTGHRGNGETTPIDLKHMRCQEGKELRIANNWILNNRDAWELHDNSEHIMFEENWISGSMTLQGGTIGEGSAGCNNPKYNYIGYQHDYLFRHNVFTCNRRGAFRIALKSWDETLEEEDLDWASGRAAECKAEVMAAAAEAGAEPESWLVPYDYKRDIYDVSVVENAFFWNGLDPMTDILSDTHPGLFPSELISHTAFPAIYIDWATNDGQLNLDESTREPLSTPIPLDPSTDGITVRGNVFGGNRGDNWYTYPTSYAYDDVTPFDQSIYFHTTDAGTEIDIDSLLGVTWADADGDGDPEEPSICSELSELAESLLDSERYDWGRTELVSNYLEIVSAAASTEAPSGPALPPGAPAPPAAPEEAGPSSALDSARSNERAHAMLLQDDGKLLVGGYTDAQGDRDFLLLRYQENGELDPTFGDGDGIVITDLGSRDEINALAFQQVDSETKIIAVGSSGTGSAMDFAVVRYNMDGSQDTGFGGGTTTYDFRGLGRQDEARDVAIPEDSGTIVLVGSTRGEAVSIGGIEFRPALLGIMRLDESGNFDTSFGAPGDDGWVTLGGTLEQFSAEAVAIVDDGILVAGERIDSGASDDDFLLAKFHPNGGVDSSFGVLGSGRIETDFSGGDDAATSILVQDDGKILVAGTASSDFAIARYVSRGRLLDSDFGVDGKQTVNLGTTFAPTADSVNDLAADGSSILFLAGASEKALPGTGEDAIAYAQLHSDDGDLFRGPLDYPAEAGYVRSTSGRAGYSIVFREDGWTGENIVIAGYTDERGDDDIVLTAFNVPTGTPDASFGSDGIVLTDVGTITAAPVMAISDSTGSIGERLEVSVSLTPYLKDISAAAFTMEFRLPEFDSACLTFDPTDSDGNGIPDAIRSELGADFELSVNADDAASGRLRFVIAPALEDPPLPTLAEGTLLSIDFTAACVGDTTIQITEASLGDSDGKDVAVEVIDGTVTVVDNRVPTANEDFAYLGKGESILINVLDNDTDPDASDTLSLESVKPPAKGSASIVGDAILYEADAEFTGSVKIAYTISDGTASATGKVTANISIRGDCSGNDSLGAEDITACILEYFDGDDNNDWLTAGDGTYAGNPVGCDANADTLIGAGDLTCKVRKLLYGEETSCAVAARSSLPPALLTLPAEGQANGAGTVTTGIGFQSNGNQIAAAVLAVKVNGAQFAFDSGDANGDGLPDAVEPHLPAGFQVLGHYQPETETLNLVIFSPELHPLPDGPLVSVQAVALGSAVGPVLAWDHGAPLSLGGLSGESVPVSTAYIAAPSGVEMAHTLFLPAVQR